MSRIEIRKVKIGELLQLQNIGIQTFRESFSEQNTDEDMSLYLEKSFSSQKLEEEIADENSEFYFAILDGKNIGYLKVNFDPSQATLKKKDSLEIERIYLLQDFQGQKIGQLLFEKAIAIAKGRQIEHIWLGVWEENPGAIRFYKKHGFQEFDSHTFKLGNDVQRDILMEMRIKK